MRRSDREITDKNEMMAIMEECDVCRLGLVENGIAYIVPLNFGYEYEGEMPVLYFHSAMEGRKVDLLATNCTVCFEMDTAHELVKREKASSYTMKYRSLMGTGVIRIIEDIEEKIRALNRIMAHYTEEKDVPVDAKMAAIPLVMCLEVQEITGKANR